MAIASVRAKLNGSWYNLTYDSASGAYKATVTAPGATSFKQSGGYYNVEIEATNTAGTTFTTSGTSLAGLRLVVKESVVPIITITSPSSGAYVTNNKPPIVFTVVDESNGSGINLSTLSVKIGSTDIPYTTTAITNGYTVTATPSAALADGSHTVTVNVKDNDGNTFTAEGYCARIAGLLATTPMRSSSTFATMRNNSSEPKYVSPAGRFESIRRGFI